MTDRAPLYRITHIARPVDPKTPTNLLIAVAAPVAGLLVGGLALMNGEPWPAAAAAFGRTALVAFLVWALARETACDEPPAGFLAAAIAVADVARGGQPDLAVLALALFAARAVNRTTGLAPKATDAVLIGALALWVGWSGLWPLTVVAGAALVLDAALDRKPTPSLFAGLAALAGAAALASRDPLGWDGLQGLTSVWLAWTALATVAGAWVIASQRRPRSVGDATGERLSRLRVRVGVAVVVVLALAATFASAPGVEAAAPLWAALVASALTRVLTLVRPTPD